MKTSYCNKYGTADIIEFREMEKPVPNDNQILIKVDYAVVSPTDCGFRSGKPFISRLFSGLIRPKAAIQGEMFSGVVEVIGSNVESFMVGDKVYGTNGMKLGAYSEYILVEKDICLRKTPEGVSNQDVITLLDGGITSLPFLRDKGKVKKGQKILIIGASGAVGSYGVTLAKHFGLHVTGVCSTANVELVKAHGADEVIDYTKTDYTKQDKQYDIIYDAVGKSSFAACKSILNDDGRYMTTVPSLGAMLKSLSKKEKPGKKELFAATGLRKIDQKHSDLELLETLLNQGSIKPLMDKVFPLTELVEAQKYVETGHKKGNVLVKI